MAEKKSPRAQVEKWKLTPDLLKLEKDYANYQKVSDLLKVGIAVKVDELRQMGAIVEGIQRQQDAMLQMVPAERQEVEGTPIPDVDFNINY